MQTGELRYSKISKNLTGSLTRDLQSCDAVPQPNDQRSPHYYTNILIHKVILSCSKNKRLPDAQLELRHTSSLGRFNSRDFNNFQGRTLVNKQKRYVFHTMR